MDIDEGPIVKKTDDKIVLARDILGIKPMFYSEKPFKYSELKKKGFVELNPRKILIFDKKTKKIVFKNRKFFSLTPAITNSKKLIIKELQNLITDAVEKRAIGKIGVLFSGGIDSSLIALLLKQMKIPFTCYTAAFKTGNMEDAQDLVWARKAAKELGVKLKIALVDDVEKDLKKIVKIIQDSDTVKVGVALPFYYACELAKNDRCTTIFSGLGSEEIFAGYERHKLSKDINKECLNGLKMMHNRDLYRDFKVTKFFGLELQAPFLDNDLIKYSLRIPSKYKIVKDKTKVIIREAALKLGLPKDIAMRKKRAAQYGSNFHKSLQRLAKQEGLKIKDYLSKLYK